MSKMVRYPSEIFSTKIARNIHPGSVVCVGIYGRYMVTRSHTDGNITVFTMSDILNVLSIRDFSIDADMPMTTVISEVL